MHSQPTHTEIDLPENIASKVSNKALTSACLAARKGRPNISPERSLSRSPCGLILRGPDQISNLSICVSSRDDAISECYTHYQIPEPFTSFSSSRLCTSLPPIPCPVNTTLV